MTKSVMNSNEHCGEYSDIFTPVGYEAHDNGVSVHLRHEPSGMYFWFDLWSSGDVIDGDWNQYIFFKNDPEDCARKEIQDQSENFSDAFSTAEYYLADCGVLVETTDGCQQWLF